MLDFNRETRLSLPQVDASNVLFRDAKAPPAAPGDAANMPETLSLAPANRSGLQQLKTECANWLTNNIANPAYNALYVNNRRMLGDLTGSDWLKSVQAAEVKPGGTLEYCAQHLSSGLAGVIPYALAGKLVGGVSRALAGTIGLTGMPARLMASETMAQISGAAAYDSLRTPGEHETRWGNALAGATAFGIFEGGNHLFKTASFIPRIAGRALTGYTGGGVQMAIAEGSAVTSQQLSEAAQSGAFLNVFLPPVQKVLGASIDTINQGLGRGVPLQRHLNRFDLSGKSAELDALFRDNPLARVQTIKTGDAHINHERNLAAVKNPHDAAELSHELHERKTFQQSKSKFQAAQELLGTNPQLAKQKFFQTCLDIELAARQMEVSIARQAGIERVIETNPSKVAKLYKQQWSKDFHNFQASGGKKLPEIGYSKDNPSGARISEIVSDAGDKKTPSRPDATKIEHPEAKAPQVAELTATARSELIKVMRQSTSSPAEIQNWLVYLRQNAEQRQPILKYLHDKQNEITEFNRENPPEQQAADLLAKRKAYAESLDRLTPLAEDFFALGLHTNQLEAAQRALASPHPEIQTDAAVLTFLHLNHAKPEVRAQAVKTFQESLSQTSPQVQAEVTNRLKLRLADPNPDTRKQVVDILTSQISKSAPPNKIEPVRILGDHLNLLSDADFAVWKQFAPASYNCGARITEILEHPHIGNLPTETIKNFLSKQSLDGNFHQQALPEPGQPADIQNAPEWARKHILESKQLRDQTNQQLAEANRPERLSVNQPWQRRSPGPSDVVERLELMQKVIDAFGPNLGPKMLVAGANNRVIFSDLMDMMRLPDNPRGQRDIDFAKEKMADIKAAFDTDHALGQQLTSMGAADRAFMQEILHAVGHGLPPYRHAGLDLLNLLLTHSQDANVIKYIFRMTREGYPSGAFDIAKQHLGPKLEMTAAQIEDAMMRDNLSKGRFPSYDEVHQSAREEYNHRQTDWNNIQQCIRELSSFNNRPRLPRRENFGPHQRNNRN